MFDPLVGTMFQASDIFCFPTHNLVDLSIYFQQGLNDGPAVYPFQPVSDLDKDHPNVETHTYTDKESGSQFYVRPNPHGPDPANPNDLMGENITEEQRQQWDLLSGYAVKVEKHKTGGTYPAWLWFSQPDMVS